MRRPAARPAASRAGRWPGGTLSTAEKGVGPDREPPSSRARCTVEAAARPDSSNNAGHHQPRERLAPDLAADQHADVFALLLAQRVHRHAERDRRRRHRDRRDATISRSSACGPAAAFTTSGACVRTVKPGRLAERRTSRAVLARSSAVGSKPTR